MNVIIVGGGKVGGYLASLLLANGYQVKLIELRDEHVHTLLRDLPAGVVVKGSGTDPTLLESSGIRKAQVVAAVTGADETNLVVSSLARFEFHVPRVIARVNNPKNAWMFTPQMGVDAALNQADLIAHLVAEEMSLGDMMLLLKLRRGQYALVEEKIPADARAVGKAVSDLELPEACVLVAVIRKGQIIVPRGHTMLEAGDEVLAVADTAQLSQLKRLLGEEKTEPVSLTSDSSAAN